MPAATAAINTRYVFANLTMTVTGKSLALLDCGFKLINPGIKNRVELVF
jgi:hypothetical protein